MPSKKPYMHERVQCLLTSFALCTECFIVYKYYNIKIYIYTYISEKSFHVSQPRHPKSDTSLTLHSNSTTAETGCWKRTFKRIISSGATIRKLTSVIREPENFPEKENERFCRQLKFWMA